MKSIYIVEDDAMISDLLKIILEREGYKTYIFENSSSFLDVVFESKPDLILLDIVLPDISGIEVCKILKQDEFFEQIPVVALSSESEKHAVVAGLNSGFDDYITKPFENIVLVAKINAILRRGAFTKSENGLVKANDEFILDKSSNTLLVSGEPVCLTALEFKTLCMLVENKNNIIKRSVILDSTKDGYSESSDRSIDKLINRIRKKIGKYSKNIVSVYGAGYCFRDDLKEFSVK